jgi:hypothetical protein
MQRVDLYADIHMSQRIELFSLVESAGSVGVGDYAAVASLTHSIGSMVEKLYRHADVEERIVHPLLVAINAPVLAKLRADHVAIDGYLVELMARCERPDLAESKELIQELYRALARFSAGYLFHLAHEEDEGSPALQGAYRDDVLAAILAEFDQAHRLPTGSSSVAAQRLDLVGTSPRARIVEKDWADPPRDRPQDWN